MRWCQSRGKEVGDWMQKRRVVWSAVLIYTNRQGKNFGRKTPTADLNQVLTKSGPVMDLNLGGVFLNFYPKSIRRG
jgi:hypothetical protein